MTQAGNKSEKKLIKLKYLSDVIRDTEFGELMKGDIVSVEEIKVNYWLSLKDHVGNVMFKKVSPGKKKKIAMVVSEDGE